MKHIHQIIITSLFTCLVNLSFAQNINWKTLQPSQKHLINLNVGLDNAAVIGVGYGYHLNTTMPLVLNLEYSQPFGKNVFDDFKTKIGGQLNLLRTNNFYATVKAYGIIRRFENDYARMVNFGSEFSATAGIYKNNWFVAPEFGFDKAIVTHLKHSSLMKEYNPQVQTGWYIPMGGNFFYGIQGGYSFKHSDVYAKIGKYVSQDFETAPMVPVYLQLGWSVKF
jgi:hypothetical protein